MQYLYEIVLDGGQKIHVVSDMTNIINVAKKAQQKYMVKLTSIDSLGTFAEINEYEGDRVKNLKAEIRHNLSRIQDEIRASHFPRSAFSAVENELGEIKEKLNKF